MVTLIKLNLNIPDLLVYFIYYKQIAGPGAEAPGDAVKSSCASIITWGFGGFGGFA